MNCLRWLALLTAIGFSLANVNAAERGCVGLPGDRDIFVQDLPPGVNSVEEIPDDFRPSKTLIKRSKVVAAIIAEAADAKSQPDDWLIIERRNHFYIEVNLDLGEDQPNGFAFHVSGSCEADKLIARVLVRLNLRALDGSSSDGLFHPPK